MYVKKFKRLFIPIYQCCFQCQLHYNLLTHLLYFSVQSFAIFMFHYKQYFKYLYDKMKSYIIKVAGIIPSRRWVAHVCRRAERTGWHARSL